MSDFPATRRAPFPRALAIKIARKAEVMAKRFEDKALNEMTRAARSALSKGVDADEVAKQLQL